MLRIYINILFFVKFELLRNILGCCISKKMVELQQMTKICLNYKRIVLYELSFCFQVYLPNFIF